ncbi:MAG TPA: coproporphyrinogen-III oxidase family protein [Thermoleophilia bacterium]|nr:coproporphyrinogen-III oxidase family protein [Thermoleophilia bacterium]
MTPGGSARGGRAVAPRHLYLHVPFCGARCDYCDFYAVALGRGGASGDGRGVGSGGARAALLDRYVAAALREWELLRERHGVRRLETVFLGGGTPSLLGEERLEWLLEPLQPLLTPRAEVTVETNPEDVTESYAAWAATRGIRVSLGVQSFSRRLRQDLGRAGTADPVAAFERLRAAGVGTTVTAPASVGVGVTLTPSASAPAAGRPAGVQMGPGVQSPGFRRGSLSVDLIFGIPGQTMADLDEELAWIARLRPDHVSWYELSVVPGTVLDARVALTDAGRLGWDAPELPDAEADAELYRRVVAGLGRLGYEWYEVSNFALPGHRCCHNSAIWRGHDYLGVGPAAVGTVTVAPLVDGRGDRAADGRAVVAVRRRDVADVDAWLEALEQGHEPPSEQEALAGDTVARERLLLAARTGRAVSLADLGPAIDPQALPGLSRAGLVSLAGGTLRVTRKGRYVANEVCVRLFRDSSFLEA